jgi:23S rRNA pseudouridine1911/1915/1917 synthase
MPRHALHAARLTLTHPMTGDPLVVEAPLPLDMAEFWNGLACQSPRGTLSRSS